MWEVNDDNECCRQTTPGMAREITFQEIESMFELRKFFCAIIAILAVVRVCGGRTDMPENPFSMQLSVLDELTLGMSVEEVIRARPNARRLVGIDPCNRSDNRLPSDYNDATLIETVCAPEKRSPELDVPFPLTMVTLGVKDGKLADISLSLMFGGTHLHDCGETLTQNLVGRYGEEMELLVGLGGDPVHAVLLWHEADGIVTASFGQSSTGEKPSSNKEGPAFVQIKVETEDVLHRTESRAVFVKLTPHEELQLFRACGLEELYMSRREASSEEHAAQCALACITDSPLEHYAKTLAASNATSTTSGNVEVIHAFETSLTPSDFSSTFVGHSNGTVMANGEWRLYWAAGGHFVADSAVTLGRCRTSGRERSFWTLHEIHKDIPNQSDPKGLLGFIESENQGLDVLITSFCPGKLSGKLETRTLAKGLSFQGWEEFEAWFSEQNTGWQIDEPVDVSFTAVSDIGCPDEEAEQSTEASALGVGNATEE